MSEDIVESPRDRVVVFFDYQNVHNWARRSFFAYGAHVSEGHINPLKTAQCLAERRQRPSVLAQARVYRGFPNPERQRGAAAANDRQAAVWKRSSMVEVIRRNLDYPHGDEGPAVEKGIDVAIAVDMIHLAMTDQMDVAILFSSDKDLLPAVELLMSERLAHVEVAVWAQAPRIRLAGTQLPWCHSIDEDTYRTLRDGTDYTNYVPSGFPSGLRPRR